MTLWIVDFEAFQQGSQFYPLEIALLNANTGAHNLFYIYYHYPIEDHTIRFQYDRHGLDWQDGNLPLGRALKAITRRIKENDKVVIKGVQKIKFFVSHGVLRQDQVIPVKETSTLKKLVQNVDQKCVKHTNLNKFWCAQQKCFAILTYIKQIKKEEDEVEMEMHMP